MHVILCGFILLITVIIYELSYTPTIDDIIFINNINIYV